MSMNKLPSHLTYFLLGFYFLYAISPLSFDLLGGQPDALNSAANKTPKIIRLFVVDEILSALLEDDDQDGTEKDAKEDNATSHEHLFLIKKKALRISVTQVLAQLSVQSAKRLGVPSGNEGITRVALMPDTGLSCPHGYLLRHSGVSPPAV